METTKQSTFNELVSPVLILVAICLVCSALLAGLNTVTAPIIEANQKAETLATYLSVLPAGTEAASLEEVDVTTKGVQGAVKSPDGSCVVKAAAAGFDNGDVTVYACFDPNGTISAVSIDASTQTVGIGSHVGDEKFMNGFVGWNGGNVSAGNPVDTYGGATYSSNAVFAAMNAAIDCYNNELN